MRDLIRHAALAAVLALSAAGCEHPAELDESAELRGGVDNPLGGEDRDREANERDRAVPPREGERAVPGPAGPRTSTPGGVASGLHDEDGSPAAADATCTVGTPAAPTCREPASPSA
jgi:hypothetical protein